MAKPQTEARCPECRSTVHRTVSTQICDEGVRMRRKECQSCGYRFYTAQPPEFTLKPSQIIWVPSDGKSSRKNVAQLRWLPGSGKSPLKKQALAALKSAEGADYPVPITALTAEQHELIRRALEQLP